MQDIYLHGVESAPLLEQPGFLDRCVCAHSLAPATGSLPTSLLECVDSGPAEFIYESIPPDYKPKLGKDAALSLQKRYGFTLPIQVMTANIDSRRKGKKLVSHALAIEIPRNSFIRIDDDLLVARPELALLHSAAILSKTELAIQCSKLFSIYEKCQRESTGVAFRQALSSYENCLDFLGSCKGANGVKSLKEALGLAVYPAASPLEIKMKALFTWPWSMGAYSLGDAESNCKVNTSSFYKDGREHTRFLDCYFPQYKVNLEYDGRSAHERRAETGKDAIRHNELASLGITEYVITKEQMNDTQYLDSIAKSVAKASGFDIPPITKAFKDRQDSLISTINRML